MASKKTTGKRASQAASRVLRSADTGKASKTAAASALTQSRTKRETTSAAAAKAASQVLRDERTSKDSKSAAGSALAQAATRKVAAKAAAKKGGGTNDTGPKKKK